MAYIVPQAVVHQELLSFPPETVQPLRPHIAGGHAWLVRYADADEKILGRLGAYDPAVDTSYSWPNRPVGSRVDLPYTAIYIDEALLEYFTDLIGEDSVVAPVGSRTDRVRSSTVGFRTNTSTYPRSAALYDRDVAAGDVVYLRGVVDDESLELWTYVRGFAYEQTAAVTGSATADAGNVTTRSASSSVAFVDGPENCIDLLVDLTNYNSWKTGDVDEVYTVEVIQGSVDSDFTTALVRVTSASGNDDDLEVAPEADGDNFSVGVRGLLLSFTVGGTGSSCSGDEEGLANDLRVGQTWEVTVTDDTKTVIGTSAGTYTGDIDATIVVDVTRGGLFAAADAADKPQISARTTTGTDLSGPTTVLAENTAYAVGTQGVTIKFTASDTLYGLVKGDSFTISVTAAGNGRVSTLILGHGLGDLVDATDMDLRLYIKKNIEVTENRISDPPLVNWEAAATEVTLNADITAYDSTWTDDGVELPMPVMGGTAYAEYRAWISTLVEGGSIDADEDLDDVISGALTPDNTLKYGVHIARSNSNGTAVKFSAVEDPDDLGSWTDMLDQLDGADGVYGMVPLSHNTDVHNAYAGYVAAQSAAEHGHWRRAYIGISIETDVAVVSASTSTDEGIVLATVTDDPETSGTQYTWLSVPAANGQFVVNDVAPGDTVRTNYRTDGFGGTVYDEYVVDTVINEDIIRLVAGPDAAINTAQKIEIWHTRSKNEQAEAYAAAAGGFGSQRVSAIWSEPGRAEGRASYFDAAAVAGRRGGIVPQQGQTNLALTGLQSSAMVGRAPYFNRSQLNTMAESGVHIIVQNAAGNVYARHALTTDMTSTETREETMVANFDSMSYYFLEVIKRHIGVSNVTPELLATLRVELDSAIDVLKGTTLVGRIGPQLIDGTITELRQHLTLRDHVLAVITLVRPYPLNNVDLYLVG